MCVVDNALVKVFDRASGYLERLIGDSNLTSVVFGRVPVEGGPAGDVHCRFIGDHYRTLKCAPIG